MSVAALRYIKALLVGAVALWGFVGVTHNLHNWPGTLGAVEAATSMSTFEGGADSWQATRNPLVIWLGALFIAGSKVVTGSLCALGAYGMLRARRAGGAAFAAARRTALVGCGVAVLMLFAGFTVIAESGFELWRSDALRGPVLDSSMRYAALIALIGLFVAAPEP